jgi:cytochrome c-type biogenesis protein CcmE
MLAGSALGVLAIAVALMLNAFRDSIVFFNSPSDAAEKHIAAGTRIRIGGLVKEGSVVRGDNLKVRFDVTDGNRDVQVAHQGVLPDLFRAVAHLSTGPVVACEQPGELRLTT